jgi:predicted 3-demethylubiquinone-9 3-methyltransferase (glyoxalase superfamily)
MQTITPFLWFNDQAEEASSFYVSVFRNSKIGVKTYYNEDISKVAGRPVGSLMTVDFQLEGQEFIALNGNREEPFTPAVSFFVACETPEEVDRIWQKLSEGGSALMELGQYPFSEKYGWVQDKFGVSWQLILAKRAQKITPCLLFVGKQAGKAEEAINRYTSLFPNSSIVSLARYTADEGPDVGRIKHATFSLNGQEFIAMDSGMPEHGFTFTMAISLMVNCETQSEVDHFWEGLTAEGEAIACGWLCDPYGLAWQVTPIMLNELRKDPDPEKVRRAMKAMMQMKKLEIQTLKQAAEQSSSAVQ